MPKQKAFGSGFFIDLDKGYLITNNHVIDDADTIEVKLANDKSYEAEVVGKDPKTDLAVIKLKVKNFDKNGLTALVVDNAEKIEAGTMVWALGAPFHLEASVSQGIISATGRGSLSNQGIGDFIQTDAAINPGNSGGPLVNAEGKVVGVNTAIFRTPSGVYNGVSFAIPASIVRRVVSSLINDGKVSRGFIGVHFQAMQPEWAKTLNLPNNLRGFIVSSVTKNGPAEKAGIKPGDIIYQVGEKKFVNSSDLVSIIGLMKPGQKTNVKLYRNGKEVNLELEIGLRPEDKATQKAPSSPKKPHATENPFGFTTTPLSAYDNEFISKHKIKTKEGLVVTDVDANGIAGKIGLKEFDVIVSINLRSDVVRSSQALNSFLNSTATGSSVIIGVERDGEIRYVELKKVPRK